MDFLHFDQSAIPYHACTDSGEYGVVDGPVVGAGAVGNARQAAVYSHDRIKMQPASRADSHVVPAPMDYRFFADAHFWQQFEKDVTHAGANKPVELREIPSGRVTDLISMRGSLPLANTSHEPDVIAAGDRLNNPPDTPVTPTVTEHDQQAASRPLKRSATRSSESITPETARMHGRLLKLARMGLTKMEIYHDVLIREHNVSPAFIKNFVGVRSAFTGDDALIALADKPIRRRKGQRFHIILDKPMIIADLEPITIRNVKRLKLSGFPPQRVIQDASLGEATISREVARRIIQTTPEQRSFALPAGE